MQDEMIVSEGLPKHHTAAQPHTADLHAVCSLHTPHREVQAGSANWGNMFSACSTEVM